MFSGVATASFSFIMNQYLCTINTLIIHVLTVFMVPRSSPLSQCTISKSQAHIGGVFFFLLCF